MTELSAIELDPDQRVHRPRWAEPAGCLLFGLGIVGVTIAGLLICIIAMTLLGAVIRRRHQVPLA